MYKLPFSGKNTIRARENLVQHHMSFMAAPKPDDSDHVVEFAIPGLMDPTTIKVSLEHVEEKLTVVVRGDIFNQDLAKKGVWRIENTSVVPFVEMVDIPLGATNPTPKATLTVSKDNCGNIDGGILQLSWTTLMTQVPVEIKDCSPAD